MRVQKRNVSMVYQQFINYPNLTVYENIASPLRVAGLAQRRDRGRASARPPSCCASTPMLKRRPSRAFRRPAAAHRARPRPRQGRRPRPPRRAARQPRLQAARGTARRAAEALRRPRRDRRLRDDRAHRGAALRRQHRDAARGPRHAVRADRRDLPQAERPRHARRSSPIRRSTPRASTRRAATLVCRRRRRAGPRPPRAATLPDGDYTLGLRPHHVTPAAPDASGRARSRAACWSPSSAGSESVVHFDVDGRHLGVAVARRPSLSRSAHDARFYRRHVARALCFSDAPAKLVAADGQRSRIDNLAPRATMPNPQTRRRLGAEARRHSLGRTAAPMRCSGPPAAARPRSSTSSPASSSRPRAASSSTAATSPTLSAGKRNIAQVFQFPVVYDTMTRLRQSRLPAPQPRRRRGRRSTSASATSPTMLELTPTLRQSRRRPHRRRQAEDLAGPRPGAHRRQRHHVRRAADRHRSASEMAAALQAEGAAPAHPLDDDLRDP